MGAYLMDFNQLNTIWRSQVPSNVNFDTVEEIAIHIYELVSNPVFKDISTTTNEFFMNFPRQSTERYTDPQFLKDLSFAMMELAREFAGFSFTDKEVSDDVKSEFICDFLPCCFFVSYKCGNKRASALLIRLLDIVPNEFRHINHNTIVRELTRKAPSDSSREDWVNEQREKDWLSRREKRDLKTKNDLEKSKSDFLDVIKEEFATVLEAPPAGTHIYVCTSPIELSQHNSDKQTRERAKNLNKLLRLRPWPNEMIEKLTAEFPWASEAIQRIAMDIAMSKRMRGDAVKIAPICLIGSAGVGKSRLARRIGELAGEYDGPSHTIFSASGSTDNRTMQGTSKGYSSASPSLPVSLIMESECANPIIICEEIDKIGNTQNGNLAHTLLMMTERSTSEKWFDECLSTNCDISYVSWIFTANNLDKIDPLLKARLKILEVPKPRPQDFDVILKGIFTDISDENFSTIELLPTIDPMIMNEIKRGFQKGNISARLLSKVVKKNLEIALEYENSQLRH